MEYITPIISSRRFWSVNAEQNSGNESEDLIWTAVDVELSIRAAKDAISTSFPFESSPRPHDEGMGERDAKIGMINGLGRR
jgi:hypothetical protein